MAESRAHDPTVTDLKYYHGLVEFDPLPAGNFKEEKQIAASIDGGVFMMTRRREKDVVAVKRILNLKVDASKDAESNDRTAHFNKSGSSYDHEVLNEIGIYQHLSRQPHRCSFLIDLIGVYRNETHTWLVLEYGGCELFDEMTRIGPSGDKMVRRWTWQLLSATRHLHLCNVGHRDISAENCLLDNSTDRNLRLYDFGQCVRLWVQSSDGLARTALRYFSMCGKSYYRPPEAYVPKQDAVSARCPSADAAGSIVLVPTEDGDLCEVSFPDDAVEGTSYTVTPMGYRVSPFDLFSVGVMVFIMQTQCPPWKVARLNDEIFQFIQRNGLERLFKGWRKPCLPPPAMEMLGSLLQSDPTKRPSASFCLKNEWFAEVNANVTLLSGESISADASVGSYVVDLRVRLQEKHQKQHVKLICGARVLSDEERLTEDVLKSGIHGVAMDTPLKNIDEGPQEAVTSAEAEQDSTEDPPIDSVEDSAALQLGILANSEAKGDQAQDDLRRFLVARSAGRHDANPPEDYVEGPGVLGHKMTGITLLCPPLQITNPTDDGDADIALLYHYAPLESYSRITASSSLTHLRASYGERAHFGDGVYTTQFAPHEFGSKDAILLNNYTNKSDPDQQERQIGPWRQKGVVDYCIPLIVPRAAALNVRIHKTKEMDRPGYTARHYEPLREGRDVWVVVISDAVGEAQNVVESFESTYIRLHSTDWNVRLHAVEVLAGVAASSVHPQATHAVVNSLQDKDPYVCVAAIWAVACSKALTLRQAREFIEQVIDYNTHPKVKDAVLEARHFLSKDTQELLSDTTSRAMDN